MVIPNGFLWQSGSRAAGAVWEKENVVKESKKRDIFALDLSDTWKKALQQKLLPLYPNFRSMAALARQVFQEFILCHLTEAEAHNYGLLARYQSIGKPDALLFAIGRSEELRRNVQGESGEQGTVVEPVRRKAGGGGRR